MLDPEQPNDCRLRNTICDTVQCTSPMIFQPWYPAESGGVPGGLGLPGLGQDAQDQFFILLLFSKICINLRLTPCNMANSLIKLNHAHEQFFYIQCKKVMYLYIVIQCEVVERYSMQEGYVFIHYNTK